jgi:hypothetical protein
VTAAASPSQPLFSSHSVYGLAKAARLKKDKPLPEKEDDVYKHLALVLTRLKHLFENGQPGVALERERNRKEIACAILTLTELLPATRIDYEVEFAAIEKWGELQPGYTDWARKNLAAFDGLASAASEARERGLPIADNIDCLAPKVTGETDFIKRLDSILSTSRVGLSVSERHRFIAEVVRLITGETIDQEKVRDRIRKAPLVNKGK